MGQLKNKQRPYNNAVLQLHTEQMHMLGESMSFEAAEAYNLLRTNIMLSFPDEEQCRVIGITSAFREEGKSISSINIAWSFANMGKSVLLLECDLRLPTIAKRLALKPEPGLSNVLTGQCKIDEAIQTGPLKNMHYISAGNIPPNPSELLGSNKMKDLINQLKDYYEYIFFDLPPVNIVADALVVSKLLDGMLIVVRENYSERGALMKMVRQFEFADVRVLGFIYNCITDSVSKYGRKYEKEYRKKYKYYKKQQP